MHPYYEQMLSRLAFLVVMISVVALGGCASVNEGQTPDSPTTPDSAGADTAELEELEYWPLPSGKDFFMPQLVGLSLDAISAISDELDFEVNEEDASEDDRVAWIKKNWTVVSQDPKMGTPMKAGEHVDISVLKNAEAVDAVEEFLETDTHSWEKRFVGEVTSVDEPLSMITVDEAWVDLDLIGVMTDSCEVSDNVYEQAIAMKEVLLPVGSRVLVVRSEPNSDSGFVHLLESPDDLTSPPSDSINEALVRTGWWGPKWNAFDGGFAGGGSAGWATSDFVPKAELTATQTEYAPLIAGAANKGVADLVGGLGLCRLFAERNLAEHTAYIAESEERLRLFKIEIDRRIREGYYSCRDGDGDGVCYER